MKKNKMKIFCLSIISITFLSSASAFAKTTVNNLKYTSSTTHSINELKENSYVVDVSIFHVSFYEYIQIDFSDGFGYSFSTTSLVGHNCTNDSMCVEALQGLLNYYGYSLTINGIFDNNTFNALIDYQKKHSECNRIDGMCDKLTWGSLVNNF